MLNKNVFPPNSPFRSQKYLMDELMKMSDEINRENEEALKQMFKNDIKGSFLISMLDKVKEKVENLLEYYPNFFNINAATLLTGNTDNMEFDICCHIVGIHRFKMLFLRDDEKGALQKDVRYQEELLSDVINHIKLRKYGSFYFRTHPLLDGDRFLFFPLAYDSFVATMYLWQEMNDNHLKVDKLNSFYAAMLSECVSILTLIENGLLIQAYPQIRNLIELYFKYEVLKMCPKAINNFFEFCDYEVNYTCNKSFNDAFLKKYEPHKGKVDIIDYLHYGWIDSIFEFNYLEKDKKYSIPGLYNFLKMNHSDKNSIEALKYIHDLCHAFSHGTPIVNMYPIKSFFEISPALYYVLHGMLVDFFNHSNKESNINGINLKKKMETDFRKLNEKWDLLTVEKAKKYYGIK